MRQARLLFLFIVLATVAAAAYSQAKPAKKPLSNDDIVQMVKAGLAESTISLAIEQGETNFDTSPTALVQLKNDGVTPAVIDTMLRNTNSSLGNAPEANIQNAPSSTDWASLAEGTYYRKEKDFVRLQPLSMSGGGATHMGKLLVPGLTPHMVWTFRGATAPVQIDDPIPSFYIKQNPQMMNIAGHSPRDLVLVRFDRKKDHRELQTTSGGNMFTFKAGFSKEKTPEIEVTQVSESIVMVRPKQKLPAGEYLLTYGLGASGFDFGIVTAK